MESRELKLWNVFELINLYDYNELQYWCNDQEECSTAHRWLKSFKSKIAKVNKVLKQRRIL